ncbi:hypothetical protein I3760_05G160100 [Carya illinoinensis]|nr:hypothetical protein I3760_05G160100 [Carya illinoinensis]
MNFFYLFFIFFVFASVVGVDIRYLVWKDAMAGYKEKVRMRMEGCSVVCPKPRHFTTSKFFFPIFYCNVIAFLCLVAG